LNKDLLRFNPEVGGFYFIYTLLYFFSSLLSKDNVCYYYIELLSNSLLEEDSYDDY